MVLLPDILVPKICIKSLEEVFIYLDFTPFEPLPVAVWCTLGDCIIDPVPRDVVFVFIGSDSILWRQYLSIIGQLFPGIESLK